MRPARAPTRAPVGGPGLSRPQPRQASTTGQGANSVMIRPLFALEDVVLYIFVVVRSFFVWIFFSVYSRAMNVPDLSNMPRPLSLLGLAAGSPAAPPEPADVAPATPRASGSRSAWSTRGRIVEGLLSAVVFVYAVRGWMSGVFTLAKPSIASMLSIFLSSAVVPDWSVFNVPLTVGGRSSDELYRDLDVDLDVVDPSEYDYFQKRYCFEVLMFELLVPLHVIAILLGKAFALYDSFISSLSLGPVFLAGAMLIAYPLGICLWLLLFGSVMYVHSGDHLYKLKGLCINQPRCGHVRAFLLAGGMICAVWLHLSPVPSKWAWSLIATHCTRLLYVIVALRGDNGGVADAAAEIAAHVPEVV
ncbi:unnamed protein product [Ectocarpus sp. 8 AP-2014]